MPTPYTNYNPISVVAYTPESPVLTGFTVYTPTSSASYTPESGIATIFRQLEPNPGFGNNPFGSPSNGEFKIHDRGFGDPTTKYIDI